MVWAPVCLSKGTDLRSAIARHANHFARKSRNCVECVHPMRDSFDLETGNGSADWSFWTNRFETFSKKSSPRIGLTRPLLPPSVYFAIRALITAEARIFFLNFIPSTWRESAHFWLRSASSPSKLKSRKRGKWEITNRDSAQAKV